MHASMVCSNLCLISHQVDLQTLQALTVEVIICVGGWADQLLLLHVQRAHCGYCRELWQYCGAVFDSKLWMEALVLLAYLAY